MQEPENGAGTWESMPQRAFGPTPPRTNVVSSDHRSVTQVQTCSPADVVQHGNHGPEAEVYTSRWLRGGFTSPFAPVEQLEVPPAPLSCAGTPRRGSPAPRGAEIGLAYARWGEELVAEGWRGYLLSFMFQPLGGPPAAVAGVMEREVERVYATALTRIVRRPAAAALDILPVWFCAHDRPVFKHARQSRRDVLVNGGRHVHAAAFLPPWTRLRGCFADHLRENVALYVPPGGALDRLDAVPITHRVGYVVGYARKATGRDILGEDASFVLPRTLDQARADAAARKTEA